MRPVVARQPLIRWGRYWIFFSLRLTGCEEERYRILCYGCNRPGPSQAAGSGRLLVGGSFATAFSRSRSVGKV